MTPRRAVLLANFDCERRWGDRAPLPARVVKRLAPLAPLMAGLVPRGMAWRLLGAGEPPATNADEEVVAWGAFDDEPTPCALASEPRRDAALAPCAAAVPMPDEAAVWSLLVANRPTRAAAAAASNRREVARLHDALGVSFGPIHVVDSMAQLAAALSTSTQPFILKPSLTAAGRDRVVMQHSSESRTFDIARGLLRDHGRAILEPWVRRTRDIGQVGLLSHDGTLYAYAPHEIIAATDGTFVGAKVHGDDGWLPAAWRHELSVAFAAAARLLTHVGYVGPFGIDAFAYETAAGEVFRPLCEINPRLTFGWLAQAWSRRLATPGLLTLRRPREAQGPALAPAPAPTAVPLTAPAAAWFVPTPHA